MITRRSLLRKTGTAAGLAAAGLSFAGLGGANESSQYLVPANNGKARRRIESAGFTVQASIDDAGVFLVTGPAGERESLAKVPGVRSAARNPRFRFEGPAVQSTADSVSEPFYPLQWDKQVTGAAAAHDVTTGEGSTIAILDTGVHYDHPDLAPNLDANAGRLFRGGQIYSGTQRPVMVPVDPTDVTQGVTTVTRHVADDAQYHGSHVAGIAAAAANDIGVVGTAPDATIVSLRVFYWDEAGPPESDDDPPEGSAVLTTTSFDILQAISYAAATGVDAANLSLGTPPLPPQVHSEGVWQAYQQVIQAATSAGTLIVASAGNAEADLQHGGQFSLPNSTAGALSVSATAPNDELVFYSNYGTNEIDIGAPGGGYETLRKSLCQGDGTVAGCDPSEEDCSCTAPEWPYPTNLVLSSVPPRSEFGQAYAYLAGTSMAAPQVTGTAALLRDVDSSASPKKLERALRLSADGARGSNDPELGAGRLDVPGAVEAVTPGGGNGR